tara:strand:+ start:8571 stop:9557 length:987 start_codon:yes stop_codon:yes gene_type:complete
MKDLTILIQGPFFRYKNFNSNKNIKILRSVFKGAKILISTWKGENQFKINKRNIIFNKDPGFVKDNHIGSSTPGSNINRQIVSVKKALSKINTKYTLKIRADCFFKKNTIIKINKDNFFRDNKYKFFKERIITSSVGTLHQSVTSILYNYSDWYNFGLTKDLKKLWSVPIVKKDQVNFFSKYPNKKDNILGRNWDLKYTAEQNIYFKSIKNKIKYKINHAHDFDKRKLLEANKFLVNNFYLSDLDSVGFIMPKYDPRINLELPINSTNIRSKELMFLSYSNLEWLNLYFKVNLNKNIKSNFNFKKNYFRFKFIIKKKIFKLKNNIFNQ